MIKAAMVTPNLTLGGAERWLVDLIKHSDPDKVEWTGVAASSFGGLDMRLGQELAKVTHIYSNRPLLKRETSLPFYWPAVHERTGPDFRGTIKRAAKDADVIVTWGTPDVGYWFDDYHIPIVCCSHTTQQEAPLAPIRGVSHLTAVSQAAMAYFKGRPGSQGLPKQVIYNGADPNRCRQMMDRRHIREEWGVEEYDVVVGYMGRQSSEKNPRAAAEAVSYLPSNYHAVYYGHGPSGKDFCPDLVKWCNNRIPGRGHFFHPDPHVGDILGAFDVLVLASHREAFSLTLIEAWLAGIPVVATPVGSIPELERQYGPLTFRIPLNSTPAQLADAVHLAVSAKNFREQIVENSYRLATTQLTVQAMADRWATYLTEIA